MRNITREDGDRAGELSAEQVAGYIAKYATKATESFGSGLDRRLTDANDLEHLDKLPAHVAELVRAAWSLGGRPELQGLRLRAWAHMLGFGGHWSTKSRRYSTTFTVLRRARVAFAKRRRASGGVPLGAWNRPEDDDQAVIVVASWVYVGSGYATEGERWLALSAAARGRGKSDALPRRSYELPRSPPESKDRTARSPAARVHASGRRRPRPASVRGGS